MTRYKGKVRWWVSETDEQGGDNAAGNSRGYDTMDDAYAAAEKLLARHPTKTYCVEKREQLDNGDWDIADVEGYVTNHEGGAA